jgi:hypothetical protein
MTADRRVRGTSARARLGRGLIVGAALALAFVLVVPVLGRSVLGAGDAFAGDAKAKKKAKAKAAKSKHLAFQATYEKALLEGRIRNLPVFVSRHKDF